MESIYNKSVYQNNSLNTRKRKQIISSPTKSPKRRNQRPRHSLHPNSILFDEPYEERYSPHLAEKALESLNPIMPIHPLQKSFHARRTSVLILGKKNVEPVLKSPEKVNVSLTPSDFDEKIKKISSQEFTYHFGIKMNENGLWDDSELALQSLNIFVKYFDLKYNDLMLLICSFLLHDNYTKVQEIIPLLHTQSIYALLLDHHLRMKGYKRFIHNPINECESILFKFLNSKSSFEPDELTIGPLRLLKHLISFQNINSNKAFEIFGMINDGIVLLSTNVIADFIDNNGQRKNQNEKLWNSCWSCFTANKAPWHLSLPKSYIKQIHMKRDSTLCNFMYPSKLKLNKHFNDHMDASFLRDAGSKNDAQILYEEYKKELTKKYKENAPTQLLELFENEPEIQQQQKSLINVSRCIIEIPCEIIKVKSNIKSIFTLLNDSIVLTKTNNNKTIIIKLKNIKNIYLRTRFHKQTAIEIFTINGETYFINFFDVNSLSILRSLTSLQIPGLIIQNKSFKSYFSDTNLTEQWINHKISNFEYLMKLNIYSGRSFNDTSQYPLMPWILTNYTSTKLNLFDRNNFRDLSKPIGALNENRLNQLKLRNEIFESMNVKPYLYNSGSSNSLNVYLFLLRLEPFTSLHIEIQSGRFDHPARLFASIKHSFELSYNNLNDYLELIPEFYFSPEFLINKDHFDLGYCDSTKIDDVELPPWAKTPYDFIYLHRKALESDYISENLNNWIDLIWGEKQNGEKSYKADNVFLPEMYQNIWNEKTLSDPNLRSQIEAILCHVGQVPPQLFDNPHPKRTKFIKKPIITETFNITLTNSNYIIVSFNELNNNIIKTAITNYNGNSFVTNLNIKSLQTTSQFKEIFKRNRSNTTKSNFIGTIQQLETKSKNIKQIATQISFDSSIIIGQDPTELYKVQYSINKCELIKRFRDEIIALSADKDWIAIAFNTSYISLYRNEQFLKPVFTIPTFTSSISCIALSSLYNSFVCGTNDGSLLICSLNNQCVTKVVELDGWQPLMVTITPEWGFILVYMTKIINGITKHLLALYNINGDFIRNTEIDSAVVAWNCFKSNDGFDYILMADDKGKCFCFEVFFLEAKNYFLKVDDDVHSVTFLKENSIALIMLKCGKLFLAPIDLNKI